MPDEPRETDPEPLFPFRLPTRVLIRPGARRALPAALLALRAHRVLLCSDPGLAATPWPDELAGLLSEAGAEVERWDEIEPNPRTTTAEAIARNARDSEAIVALGGGSVLDAAKAAAMLAVNPGSALDFVGRDRFRRPPLPLVALPTTCGTGSEVTSVAVLTDEASRTKVSLKGEGMFPDFALVDPDLLATLPPELVAHTAADALTHAVEATTCRRANPISDALAESVIELLFRHLPGAPERIGVEAELRLVLARAATLAGIAFGNADVAAVHCLSEALGGVADVPHGLANAVLLAPALATQRPAIDRRLARLLARVSPRAASGEEGRDAARFLDELTDLVGSLGLPPFSELGVDPDDFPAIAERAAANGSNPSNRREMTAGDYLRLLESLG